MIYLAKFVFKSGKWPIKTEDLNLSVFNMITRINESKTSTKRTSCECECGFGGRQCNSDQWWNNGNCRCECKKRHVCERLCLKSCENGKYLESFLDNSTIVCDEVKELYNEETNFNEKINM